VNVAMVVGMMCVLWMIGVLIYDCVDIMLCWCVNGVRIVGMAGGKEQ